MSKFQWAALGLGAGCSAMAWMAGEPFGFGHGLWGWASWGWAALVLSLVGRFRPSVAPRAKRMLGSEGGISFFCPQFEFKIDEAKKTGRLVSVEASASGDGVDVSNGRVDIERPLLGWSMSVLELQRTVMSPIGAMAIVNGQQVPVNLGFDSELAPTGEFRVSVSWSNVELRVAADTEWRDGAPLERFRVDRTTQKHKSIFISVPTVGGPNAEIFQEFWQKVQARVKVLVEEPAIQAHKDAQESLLIAREKAKVDAQNAARAEIRSRLAELGVDFSREDGFSAWSMRAEGGIDWAIHCDREGNAALVGQGMGWFGSLASARARASIVEHPASVKGGSPSLSLLIEVRDDDYEQANLAKRRFQLLAGRPRETLVEWMDRVEILASRRSPEDQSSAPRHGVENEADARQVRC